MMYHVGFLHLVGAPPGSSLERVMDTYDGLFGCPGAALGGRFQHYVKRIMEVRIREVESSVAASAVTYAGTKIA
jgi:hypothetical protein